MKKMTVGLLLFLFSLTIYPQESYILETKDITHFWEAYDLLATAESQSDSIEIVQKNYLDKATNGFKEFLKARNFTAKEYISKIGKYPLFWQSVRPLTEQIEQRKTEIDAIFKQLEKTIPNYKQPNVCFAIGAMRTGGTISGGYILIGSEISASDQTVEKSELGKWLKSVIGTTGDIVAMVAHETIHVQQSPQRKVNLLTASMGEGIADFLTTLLVNMQINDTIHEYGEKNECELWTAFENNLKEAPKDFSNWLYNGSKAKERPADLGYFVGYKIAEAYYNDQEDKILAIKNLLNRKKYPRIFKESKYAVKACKQ